MKSIKNILGIGILALGLASCNSDNEDYSRLPDIQKEDSISNVNNTTSISQLKYIEGKVISEGDRNLVHSYKISTENGIVYAGFDKPLDSFNAGDSVYIEYKNYFDCCIGVEVELGKWAICDSVGLKIKAAEYKPIANIQNYKILNKNHPIKKSHYQTQNHIQKKDTIKKTNNFKKPNHSPTKKRKDLFPNTNPKKNYADNKNNQHKKDSSKICNFLPKDSQKSNYSLKIKLSNETDCGDQTLYNSFKQFIAKKGINGGESWKYTYVKDSLTSYLSEYNPNRNFIKLSICRDNKVTEAYYDQRANGLCIEDALDNIMINNTNNIFRNLIEVDQNFFSQRYNNYLNEIISNI